MDKMAKDKQHKNQTANRDKHRGDKPKSDKHKSDKSRVAKKDARDNKHDKHDPDEDYLRDIHNYRNNNNFNNFNYRGHYVPGQAYNGYANGTYTGNGASYAYSGYPPAYSGYPGDNSAYNPAYDSTSARAGPMTNPYLHESTVTGRFTSGERRDEGEHVYDMHTHLDRTCDVLKKEKKHSKM